MTKRVFQSTTATNFGPVTLLAAIAAALLVLSSAPVRAQKAEPSRIQFRRGASGAILRGVLRDRQQKEYQLKAGQGQKLELDLRSSPAGTSAIKMFGGNGAAIPLDKIAANRWSVVLQEAGELVIIVHRTSDEHGRSAFTLRVDIR
jgi:hypothetical protein